MKIALPFALSMIVAASAHAHDGDYKKYEFPVVKERSKPTLILVPGGETFQVVRAQNDTCGKYMFAKLIVPPGVGPSPHVHHWTDEWFWAPEGGISMTMGKTAYPDVNVPPGEGGTLKDDIHFFEMRPKELFYGERYYIHSFVNTSSTTKILYLVWTPDTPDVSILDYFLSSGEVIDKIDENRTPSYLSKVRGVNLAPKWGFNQSSDFWQYVRVGGVTEDRPKNHGNDQHARLEKLLREGESCFVDSK